MRIKSLLVSLGILGTSSLALADHSPTSSDGAFRDDTYRDDTYRDDTYRDDIYRDDTYRDDTYRDDTYRDDTYRDYAPRPTTWVPLTSHVDLDRRLIADVSTRQRFGQLRIQNQHGRSLVRAIVIQFANGERQRVAVNRVLAGNRAMVNVDLAGDARRIDRVIVFGRSGHGAALQLYAM